MVFEKTSPVSTAVKGQATGMESYLRKIFALMFGAVLLTAIASFFTIWGGYAFLINMQTAHFTALYYILLFGGLALSIWAQIRAFKMSPLAAIIILAIYSISIGIVITPLVAFSLVVNPLSVLWAFIIAAVMFACMALFGYKTLKDLSFLGIFLFLGMIGLILVGILSIFLPMGGTFGTIICLIGVLIFALFTAYDMQNLKRAYSVIGGERTKNQLAVLGALHLYISFIAMFQYILSLFNSNR